MYRAIVAAIVRRTWRKVDESGPGAVVSMAAPDMAFTFVGDTAVSATLRGPAEFEAWFHSVADRLPGLRFAVRDVIVRGWPWNTQAAVRLDVSATLLDGTPYNNVAVQWIRLRWGRLTEDWVLEDTLKLHQTLQSVPHPAEP